MLVYLIHKIIINKNHPVQLLNLFNRYHRMTMRRIHQNLSQIKHHNHTPTMQNLKNPVLYDDQQQPPRPKIMLESPVMWENLIIRHDFFKSGQKVNTARQNKRQIPDKTPPGRFTALNSSRHSKYQVQQQHQKKNNSPRSIDGLFIPERNKAKQKNKLAFIKNQSKAKNPTFNSPIKKSLSICYGIENEQTNDNIAKKSHEPNPIQPNKTIHYISHLRKYQHEQKQRETVLNNRLKFITIGQQKDQKKLQMVKKKFQKVISIRTQFTHERQSFNKIKNSIERDDWKNKFSKVNSVKRQHEQRRLSVSRLSEGKTLQASRIRDEQKTILRQIMTNRLIDLQRKKQTVKKAKTSLEKSRQKISEMTKSRISSIRTIQNKSLIKNYMNVQKQNKINQKLYENLQHEISLINERKLKAASELKQYKDFLELNGKLSKEIPLISALKQPQSTTIPFNRNINNAQKLQRAVSSTFSKSGSKSFYLTNY